MSPSSVQRTTTTRMPAMLALAGLVPCAEEGIRQTVRLSSPRERWQPRMASSPAYSPWLPALGCSETASKPVISASQRFQFVDHRAIAGRMRRRREGMQVGDDRPAHRHHLGRGVELHGAGAERDHRCGRAPDPCRPAGAGSASSRFRSGSRGRPAASGTALPRGLPGRALSAWSGTVAPNSAAMRLEVGFGRRLVEADGDAVGVDDAQQPAACLGGLRRWPAPLPGIVARSPCRSAGRRQPSMPAALQAGGKPRWPALDARRRSPAGPPGRARSHRPPPCWRAAPARCRCWRSPCRGGCAARASAARAGSRAGPCASTDWPTRRPGISRVSLSETAQ